MSRRRGGIPRKLVLLPALWACLIAGGITPGMGRENQEEDPPNPYAGDAGAPVQGRSLFRIHCAFCHGIDARGGGRGPDLTLGRWVQSGSDAALFRTIEQGVSGTEMPAYTHADNTTEIWMLVSFLRTLGEDSRPPVAGNRASGEKIFFVKSNCSQCHMIQGQGGLFGPDLSRVGRTRSADYLIQSIREPGKKIPDPYKTVTVVRKDGERITGVRKNEDTFSIQLMSPDEQLHFILKKDLKEVIYESDSLMPAYSREMLNEKDLQDLVAYLDGLRDR